jgi:hypothetical protein
MSRGVLVRVLVLACAALALLPAAASAVLPTDPGRWSLVDRSTIPLVYFQGVTSEPGGDLFFDGISTGLYRSNSQLGEKTQNPNVIPPAVGSAESYNHIGDISYDEGEGGRLLLPMECYYPGTSPNANTCQTGAIGVADPQTLQWRYYVKLDPTFIKKAMWAEVSPDGSRLWTQQDHDLLVYDMDDITEAHAWNTSAPNPLDLATPIHTYTDAVPPSGVTGATFFRGRLYMAGSQDSAGPTDTFQVWSIDPNAADVAASKRLEIVRQVAGESEGLDVFGSLGGVLHWQIQPISNAPATQPATFDPTRGSLLSFVPTSNPQAEDIRDADDDGFADADDGCPSDAGQPQSNPSANGCPFNTDVNDTDVDNVPNGRDNCVATPNNFQANADQDLQGDACDTDDDGDEVADATDNCHYRTNADQLDTDGDGQGNACEDDDDNDTIVDYRDNCPVNANVDQADSDGDGIGDACEPAIPPVDNTAPQTTIGKAKINSSKRKATFAFASNELGTTFDCTLDGKHLKKCSSPLTLKHLEPGKHKFGVAAIDVGGNRDATPATKKFKIKKPAKRGHNH